MGKKDGWMEERILVSESWFYTVPTNNVWFLDSIENGAARKVETKIWPVHRY